jgi:hypothetical protein
MLIESSALYAVTSLLFIGPYAANNYASDIFLPILAVVQVGIFVTSVWNIIILRRLLQGYCTFVDHSSRGYPERTHKHDRRFWRSDRQRNDFPKSHRWSDHDRWKHSSG